MHTGTTQFGGASLGAWATYGLGTENQNLPGFVVLTSGGKTPDAEGSTLAHDFRINIALDMPHACHHGSPAGSFTCGASQGSTG